MNTIKFLTSLYYNMKCRVNSKKRKRYYGLSICSKLEFISFSLNAPNFIKLYAKWSAAKSRAITPSIDRVDANKGYTLDNMRWLTVGDNSRRARFELRCPDRKFPMGVRFYGQSYSARIRNNYKEINLGKFKTAEAAHKAYLKAKKEFGR